MERKRFLRRQENVIKSQILSKPSAIEKKRRSPEPPPRKFEPTIPEPFEMTIREDNKRKDTLLALQVLKEKFNEEHDKVEKPSEKHFRAIEVPDHVRENRYEKLVKHQEKKRKKAKEEAKKDLEKKIQPFSFVEREERKIELRRSDSVPNLKVHNNQKHFQAHPFPEHLFTDFANEQQKERENYREIQKKLRQEMLMKKSSFPPRMSAEFLKKKMQENKELSKKSKHLSKKVKQEKSNLDRLYYEYRENLERKKIENDLSAAIKVAKLHERPSKSVKKRPLSADSANKRSEDVEKSYNLTTQLRLKLLEEKEQRKAFAKVLIDREEKEREDRARRRRMNNPVWDNIKNDFEQNNISELTQKRLDAEKIRMKNYKLELEEMMRRVENQPTLFQKQSQVDNFWIEIFLKGCGKYDFNMIVIFGLFFEN